MKLQEKEYEKMFTPQTMGKLKGLSQQAREIEAHIRIQTANQNIQGIGPLQGSELIADARTEKENLITELKEMLNETSRRGQLERKQQESQFHRDTLQQIPLPIYIL